MLLVILFGFGGLLSAFLIKIGLKPLPALIAPQAVFLAIDIWNNSHDGAWDLDWLKAVLSALLVLLLRGWARRRWEKRHPEEMRSGLAGSAPEPPRAT